MKIVFVLFISISLTFYKPIEETFFQLGDSKCTMQIFSQKGITYTLKKNNNSYPQNLILKIKSFSDSILNILISQKNLQVTRTDFF